MEEDTIIFERTETRMPALQTWTKTEKNFHVTLAVLASIMLIIFNGFPHLLHLHLIRIYFLQRLTPLVHVVHGAAILKPIVMKGN